MLEFNDDGTLNFSPGAVVEMKYRIEGAQLILPPASTSGPEQRETMKWVDQDHLLLNGSQTLSRQGDRRDPNNTIVGEWTAPYEMPGAKLEVRYFFDPDGKSLLLVPFKWQKGRYSVKGTTIRIEYPASRPAEGPFRIEGDVLTIPTSGGTRQSQLRRY